MMLNAGGHFMDYQIVMKTILNVGKMLLDIQKIVQIKTINVGWIILELFNAKMLNV
jgi:hypothetical protein